MFGFAMFLDLVRALMWPFPWAFCIISVFIKNVTSINISLITLTLATTRFVFIFGFKRIPVMEDRFWATLLYMVTTMISFFASAIRFYLPGRQTLNEVTLFLLQNLFGAESSFFCYDLFFAVDLYWKVLWRMEKWTKKSKDVWHNFSNVHGFALANGFNHQN